VRLGIPKKAVKPLIEHCNRLGEKAGRSGAEVFEDYLEGIKRHADYFFSSPWPPRHVLIDGVGLTWEEDAFISASCSYAEEVERFTIALLKRNLSLEGFNSECFEQQFEFCGRVACFGCAVPEAVRLRKYVKELEESNAEIEQKRKLDPNNPIWDRLHAFRFSSEARRSAKMANVELDFLEVEGGAKGKACAVRNMYLCPFGEGSSELIGLGVPVAMLWALIEFYDGHWNGSSSFTPSPSDAKWYHMGEPGILDVTSRQDILDALEDGRIRRIAEERKRFTEAVKHS
jgi:hypothetical protein